MNIFRRGRRMDKRNELAGNGLAGSGHGHSPVFPGQRVFSETGTDSGRGCVPGSTRRSQGSGGAVFATLGLSAGAERVSRQMLAEPEWGVAELGRHLGMTDT